MNFFETNLGLLNELTKNNISQSELSILKSIYEESELSWKIQTIDRGLKEVKYLFICEAPPYSISKPHTYFYTDSKSGFHTRIWNSIFLNEKKPKNENEVFQKLADEGFLLIDSLPYSLKYTSIQRKSTAYNQLIKNSLNWWLQKLNSNFNFNKNTKIGFGFKLNAQNLIRELNHELNLGSQKFYISKFNIATDGSGMPNAIKLSDIFDTYTKHNENSTIGNTFAESFLSDETKYRVRRLKKTYLESSEEERQLMIKSLPYYSDLFNSFDKKL